MRCNIIEDKDMVIMNSNVLSSRPNIKQDAMPKMIHIEKD